VLRHQLKILRRGGKRPRFTRADRAFLAAAAQLLSQDRWRSFLVRPDTLIRWHGDLLRRRPRRSSRRPGRPPLDPSIKELILRMGRENPRWGYLRIRGELLKLGVDVSATTTATVLRKGGLGPAPRRVGPTWTQFLQVQAYALLSPSPGPRRRTAAWRTSHRVRRKDRPRSATTQSRPSVTNPSTTARCVRGDSPSPRWPPGRVHPWLRFHRTPELALATGPRWLPESCTEPERRPQPPLDSAPHPCSGRSYGGGVRRCSSDTRSGEPWGTEAGCGSPPRLSFFTHRPILRTHWSRCRSMVSVPFSPKCRPSVCVKPSRYLASLRPSAGSAGPTLRLRV